jgi:hypothetical protein
MPKCKVCKTKFKPKYNTLEQVCSVKCAIAYAKEKERIKKAKNESDLKDGLEQKSISKYLLTTRTIVHKAIKHRDRGKPCISCGCSWNEDFQAGHGFKAETYKSLRFDFQNINGQCVKCNIRLEGNFDNYILNLPYRIGQEEFDKLKKRAELDKHFNKHWTITELDEIRKQAKELLKIN